MKQRIDELLQIISNLADDCGKQRDLEKLFDIAVGGRLLFRGF